ncbi:hypothetical protein GNF72_15880 [Clostridium perfringens]|nr:hypothetical protein [Clostridium perfringens]
MQNRVKELNSLTAFRVSYEPPLIKYTTLVATFITIGNIAKNKKLSIPLFSDHIFSLLYFVKLN